MAPSTSWILLTLLLFPVIECNDGSEVELEETENAAFGYIMRNRDPRTLLWKPKETATVVMAITAVSPTWRNGISSDDINLRNAARVALLDLIASAPNYSGLDHSLLAQWLGVLRLMCEDAHDFHGHDLMAEAEKRVESGIPHASPANAGFALMFCVYNRAVTRRHIRTMFMYEPGHSRACTELCFERTAMNIQALSCILRDEGDFDVRILELAKRAYGSNVAFLRSPVGQDLIQNHARKNVLALILGIHANRDAWRPSGPNRRLAVNFDEVFVSAAMLDHRNVGLGDFGKSVTVTALALTAMKDFSASDLLYLKCPNTTESSQEIARRIGLNERSDRFSVAIDYEIVDDFTKSQSLVGTFFLTEETALLDVLESYGASNPEVLQLDIQKSPFGSYIQALNGVANDDRRRVGWRVYKREKNQLKPELEPNQDLAKISLKDEDTVVLKFEQI